jgi:hypothetical protein
MPPVELAKLAGSRTMPRIALIFEGAVVTMRVEATIPDGRAEVLAELSKELGASRSQLIDEALSLFFRAVMEVRRGRRLVSKGGEQPESELVTPTLTQLEWAMNRQPLTLGAEELQRVADALQDDAEPTAALKRVLRA